MGGRWLGPIIITLGRLTVIYNHKYEETFYQSDFLHSFQIVSHYVVLILHFLRQR